MIGEPLDDAKLRLECWRMGMHMAGVAGYDVAAVDKIATSIYSFIATGAVLAPASGSESRDKSNKTPKR